MIVDEQTRLIGKVISIDTYSCTVELLGNISNFCVNGFDDIHYFAQINSYVIIPQQNNYIVGEVVGIEEKEVFGTSQKETTRKDHPSRTNIINYLKVVLLGVLKHSKKDSKDNYKFEIGVSNYPPLYSNVLYVRDQELDIIFKVASSEMPIKDENGIELKDESGTPITRLDALAIGTSAIFHDYEVKVDINSFFGGHSAVLGNTGSGKSCTISAILQSLFDKQNYAALGSTFLFFDVNGEYLQAFKGLSEKNTNLKVRYLYFDDESKPGGDEYKWIEAQKFLLPHWFLNIEEWRLLLQASDRTQLPVLRNALRFAKIFYEQNQTDVTKKIKNHILAKCLSAAFAEGESAAAKGQRMYALLQKYNTVELPANLLAKHKFNVRYGNFENQQDQENFFKEIEQYSDESLPLNDVKTYGYFEFAAVRETLDLAILYEEAHGNGQIRNYCASMLTRLDSLEAREEFGFLKQAQAAEKLPNYLFNLLGLKEQADILTKDTQVIIVDMNSLEDEIIEVVSSVLTRLVFERLQKANPRNSLPVNLVLEEAHRYIPHENKHFPAHLVFERVAKEGRKYGLFLLVSSQRPSELSKTVLSQCSNFIVHRIQNPEDLIYIKRMTPHVSEMILNRLPYLPEQHALIFGSAINIPSTFKVKDANPLPKSNNNRISNNWFVRARYPLEVSLFSKTSEKQSSQIDLQNVFD